ncbi:E3 ubiquitin-protein ligase DCST1 isoform X3 [Hyperolius riggenbachi]|uniref:E3 ubiquitin-protein ligase DCST1 isoform X3 n=1 Tax=Hyperolius riggenbachi TaxID=752182 RepID=UPI0035A30789
MQEEGQDDPSGCGEEAESATPPNKIGPEDSEKTRKPKPPNTTLKRLAFSYLPDFCSSFLYCDPQDFRVSKFFLGLATGGFIGLGVYFMLIHPLEISDLYKAYILRAITGTFAIGWSLSSHVRCATFIFIPNILGPGANLQHNVMEIPRSISCSIDVQYNNTKTLWKIMYTPMKKIYFNLLSRGKDFTDFSNKVKAAYRSTEEQVSDNEGYDKEKEKELRKKSKSSFLSTQSLFQMKTYLRCEYVLELGIAKCYDWFDQKYDECMKTILLPILNHILCLPMKLKVFCNLLHWGEDWCKRNMPMKGNFGPMIDKLNESISKLQRGFSTKLQFTKEHKELIPAGQNITEMTFTEKLMEKFERKKRMVTKLVAQVQFIMSFSFIFAFVSALKYSRSYTSDILFDNCYVTTYFRQIDKRRRKYKRKHVLPLKKGEKSKFVFPENLTIQGPEVKAVKSQLWDCIIPVIFLLFFIIFNKILCNLLDIIRSRFKVSYTFASNHRVEIIVGGDSVIADIIRKSVSILNSTADVFEVTNNELCLPDPIHMSATDYFWSCTPVVGYVCLSILHVYVYRLRRVVAAFYFPKREKRRVLFLYNELLRSREEYIIIKRNQIMRKARLNRTVTQSMVGPGRNFCSWIKQFMPRRCKVCNDRENEKSIKCTTPDCDAVYCKQCWRDMKRFCFACFPYEGIIPDHSNISILNDL